VILVDDGVDAVMAPVAGDHGYASTADRDDDHVLVEERLDCA
jgi:hypothetical protein